MFTFAILIGIYSYIIFSLGLLGIFYKSLIFVTTLLYIASILILFRPSPKKILQGIYVTQKEIKALFFLLIFLQLLINLFGVFGPELSFDALWYHLTLPKIYLSNHSIFHISGGLLYYSDMPKLTEMLYAAALSLGNETIARFIHFSFGILSLFAIYKLSRKYFSQTISILAVLIFYSNPVVGWQSTVSYIDLARTFFEIMALWGFVNWLEYKDKKWLVESAVMLGLAISTKLLAVGSLLIFTLLIILNYFQKRYKSKISITNILTYWCISLSIPLPWFVLSFINTGNPIYPFFTKIYEVGLNSSLLHPAKFIIELWEIFTHSQDPLSPLYVMFIPLVIAFFRHFTKEVKLIVYYSIIALLVWYLEPRTGGGRFIMVYLPAFSIVIAATIAQLKKQTFLYRFSFMLVILISLISIIYRGVANSKYLPVIFGRETKEHFLERSLNFSFGDFYDTDNYFKKHIKESDKVLLYGFHNLYYINFPFIDSSWIRKGDRFNYIAVQNNVLPQRFEYWNLIYFNPLTRVYLYSLGGQKWIY